MFEQHYSVDVFFHLPIVVASKSPFLLDKCLYTLHLPPTNTILTRINWSYPIFKTFVKKRWNVSYFIVIPIK